MIKTVDQQKQKQTKHLELPEVPQLLQFQGSPLFVAGSRRGGGGCKERRIRGKMFFSDGLEDWKDTVCGVFCDGNSLTTIFTLGETTTIKIMVVPQF